MSNQEYCQLLHQEYFETSQAFLSVDRKKTADGSTSRSNESSDYAAIKAKWQAAIHNYWNFLMLLKRQSIDPNAEVQLP